MKELVDIFDTVISEKQPKDLPDTAIRDDACGTIAVM